LVVLFDFCKFLRNFFRRDRIRIVDPGGIVFRRDFVIDDAAVDTYQCHILKPIAPRGLDFFAIRVVKKIIIQFIFDCDGTGRDNQRDSQGDRYPFYRVFDFFGYFLIFLEKIGPARRISPRPNLIL